MGLLHMMKDFGNIELVFDTVDKNGVKMLQKKYMRQMGHKDARCSFMWIRRLIWPPPLAAM